MAKYIQFFHDAACKNLAYSLPVTELVYGYTDTPPGTTQPINGKTYRIFDGYGQRIREVPMPSENPPILSSRNTFPEPTTLYCKNGFHITFRVASNYEGNQNIAISNIGAMGVTLSGNTSFSSANPIRMWFASIVYNGTTYIGFTNATDDWTNVVIPVAFVEESFWEEAVRPAYDYGSKPDGDGGQGTGTIDDASITKGQQTGSMPTGGRGLHWYRMPNAGFNSVQDYLWGDVSGTSAVSTIVKSLWQKFQNKTYGPSQCIVGAYKLPSLFMPERGGASGVQLAGINLPTSNTYVTSPGFVYKRLNFGKQEPPFKSWLDYQGVTCKIGVPFCGEIACPVEAIWWKEVMIRYCCDQHNGNLVATVWAGDHVLGEMSGNCAYQVPVVGGDDGTLARLGALVGTAASAVAAIATDGASLAVGGVVAGAASAAGAQHHTYVTNGNLSGGVSACINGVAYIDFIYPSTAYPNEKAYADGYGYVASSAHGKIGGFKGGYGEFTVLKRNGGMMIPRATDAEKDEIIRLLETGVIV